jgi:glycosyltransferase involved in cell wall biosynthesis
MRVLLVTPSYFPIIGGSEVLTRSLATKLNENGIKADIATFNMDKKWNPKWKEEILKEGPTQVFKIGAFNPFLGLPNPLSNLFRLNVFPKPSFAKRFQDYDLIHFIGEADLSFPILSLMIDRPKIMHCVGLFRHGGIYNYYQFKRPYLKSIFMKFFSNIADIYITYSDEEKNLLSELGIPSKKIFNLPLGVDTEILKPDEIKKVENLVLFVGRIDPIKGAHVLLEALDYLETPISLVIIGPRWDEAHTKEIEEKILAINGKSVHKVELLGSIEQKDLVSWYQKASVLVCPYLYETFSIVTLEALACGTPVVSTGAHILKNSNDGILISPMNPQKIAVTVKTLLENTELRKKCGQNGRKFVEQHFAWKSIIQKLNKIYQETLSY